MQTGVESILEVVGMIGLVLRSFVKTDLELVIGVLSRSHAGFRELSLRLFDR
jgi:hypothetical protein